MLQLLTRLNLTTAGIDATAGFDGPDRCGAETVTLWGFADDTALHLPSALKMVHSMVAEPSTSSSEARSG